MVEFKEEYERADNGFLLLSFSRPLSSRLTLDLTTFCYGVQFVVSSLCQLTYQTYPLNTEISLSYQFLVACMTLLGWTMRTIAELLGWPWF